jgi:multisubunit Na+/H+ antiporter MnhG subunit
MPNDPDQRERLDTAHISKALGVFLFVFGVVILVAIFFTETTVGKITNAVAGLIIGGIGAGMFIRASLKRSRT